MLVDTHQHLFDRDRLQYSWGNGVPALARRRLQDYYREAVTAGATPITATLFVEGNVDSASVSQETDWALGLAEFISCRVRGIIAAAFPERADFATQLAPFLNRSALKGIRRVLHTAPTGLAGTKRFSRNVDQLIEYGLTFDLCVNYMQLVEARTLAASCPGGPSSSTIAGLHPSGRIRW